MKMKRLGAAVAAASVVALAFVATASPASAWTKHDCDVWNKTHPVTHPDCLKYTTTTEKPKPTTTKKEEEATTTTVKATTTTTTAVKNETAKPAPAVKTTPKFTG